MTPSSSEETALVPIRRVAGRPTEYDPANCQKLIHYFASAPQTRDQRKSTFTAENGKLTRKEEVQQICAELPTFGKFARAIGVTATTLTTWRNRYPEFDDAYIEAKDIQRDFLIQNGLAGLYNPQAFIFVAKNISGMTDRTELTGAHGSALNPAGPAPISLENVPTDKLLQIRDLMAQAKALMEGTIAAPVEAKTNSQ